jgi:hypothetical protein
VSAPESPAKWSLMALRVSVACEESPVGVSSSTSVYLICSGAIAVPVPLPVI